MKKVISTAVALMLGVLSSRGQFVGADGIYSARSSQIEIRDGVPGFNTGASFDRSLIQGFQLASRQLRQFGIFLEYGVESTGANSYRINWTINTDGTFGAPISYSISMEVSATVSFIDENTAELRTTISYITDDFAFNDDLSLVYLITFDPAKRTLSVSLNGRREAFKLGFFGTGGNELDPILPLRPNWLSNTNFRFPVFDTSDPIWADPPFAEGFEYKMANKRNEKFTGVMLPSGFGNNITVSVYKKVGKKSVYEQLPGTFNSGSTINFNIDGGVTRFKISGIRPTVDLKSERPYPVGILFTNLSEPTVSFSMKPLKKLKSPLTDS